MVRKTNRRRNKGGDEDTIIAQKNPQQLEQEIIENNYNILQGLIKSLNKNEENAEVLIF